MSILTKAYLSISLLSRTKNCLFKLEEATTTGSGISISISSLFPFLSLNLSFFFFVLLSAFSNFYKSKSI
jgi:hypothetical protein